MTGEPKRQSIQADERVFLVAVVLGILVILAIAAWSTMRDRRRVPAESFHPAEGATRRLIEFELIDTGGRAWNRRDLNDKMLVVNFVFASCSLTCLEVNYRMSEIQRRLGHQPDVQLLSLTVDPMSDTPAVLGRFAARFEADTNRWSFLTGDPKVIRSLIRESFLGQPDPALAGVIPGGFANLDRIAIVDGKGCLRATVNGLNPSAPEEVMNCLRALKREMAPR